jgi:hypothetical protein
VHVGCKKPPIIFRQQEYRTWIYTTHRALRIRTGSLGRICPVSRVYPGSSFIRTSKKNQTNRKVIVRVISTRLSHHTLLVLKIIYFRKVSAISISSGYQSKDYVEAFHSTAVIKIKKIGFRLEKNWKLVYTKKF